MMRQRSAELPPLKEMLANKILTDLPEEEFARLVPSLEPVSLTAGEILSRPGEFASYLYFPESAVVSCHADMQDGKTVEVGMIGREGAVGLDALLGSRPAAQTVSVAAGGSALKVRAEVVRHEFSNGGTLRKLLLGYAGDYVAQVSQRAACNVLHRVEQRLAVWLLMLTDRVGAEVLDFTQERIAQHLGVRRASISVLAKELQDRGAIGYTRAHLRVLDRQALEAAACECFEVLRTGGQEPALGLNSAMPRM